VNKQEIFDAVAVHLFKQGERAMNNGTCVYRSKDGLKCAVGALIPDGLYSSAMDMDLEGAGTGVSPLLERFGNILPVWFRDHCKLLMNLQDVHDARDNWLSTNHMKIELAGVAREFAIDPAILDTLSFEKDREYDEE